MFKWFTGSEVFAKIKNKAEEKWRNDKNKVSIITKITNKVLFLYYYLHIYRKLFIRIYEIICQTNKNMLK